MRRAFFVALPAVLAAQVALALYYPPGLWNLVVIGPLVLLGLYDVAQTRHAVLRNFPIVGHGRYLLEMIRPEINQYFIESNSDGRPFSRELRSIVYQRAKKQLETLPFGTQLDVYAVGYEWVNHSLAPKHVDPESLRIDIGGNACTKPYSASLFNISAMSFGSLSNRAVLSLNEGAKRGGFAHNTGEGGVSPYHLEPGGDLIWQIGTGYFGCRTPEGNFDPELFRETASHDNVKMIELKLSQGAKPGHGGILPAAKLTEELAQIRKVPMGRDVNSPPCHSAFSDPLGLLDFVAQLRELSGGKPVGIKLCVGQRREFLAICKAMLQKGVLPDFIAVDGAEGGTGAAPLEFSNRMGTPLIDGLMLVHNALVGVGLRDQIRVIAAGRIINAFDIVQRLAVGADACYSARGMMFALGCIQALRCNSNHCPVGVTTQNPALVAGLDVTDKSERVHQFHRRTMEAVAEMLGAMGCEGPQQVQPWHVMRRTSPQHVRHYEQVYHFLNEGDLLEEPIPEAYARPWAVARADTFGRVVPE